eukprot:1370920-Amorphochlora_amoeboformis.AAC.1
MRAVKGLSFVDTRLHPFRIQFCHADTSHMSHRCPAEIFNRIFHQPVPLLSSIQMASLQSSKPDRLAILQEIQEKKAVANAMKKDLLTLKQQLQDLKLAYTASVSQVTLSALSYRIVDSEIENKGTEGSDIACITKNSRAHAKEGGKPFFRNSLKPSPAPALKYASTKARVLILIFPIPQLSAQLQSLNPASRQSKSQAPQTATEGWWQGLGLV